MVLRYACSAEGRLRNGDERWECAIDREILLLFLLLFVSFCSPSPAFYSPHLIPPHTHLLFSCYCYAATCVLSEIRGLSKFSLFFTFFTSHIPHTRPFPPSPELGLLGMFLSLFPPTVSFYDYHYIFLLLLSLTFPILSALD